MDPFSSLRRVRAGLAATLTAVLLLVPSAHASVSAVEGFHARVILSDPSLDAIRGVIDWPEAGSIILSRSGGAGSSGELIAVDPADGTVTPLFSGLPLGTPDRMTWGDGSALLGDSLILADHNTDVTDPCCDGRVFRVDLATMTFTELAAGNPEYTTPGDPYGVAIAPMTSAFAQGLYVVDFEGASVESPLIYRIDPTGTAMTFALDPVQWTTSASPKDLAFDPTGAYGGDLFVTDDGNADRVWRVAPSGAISSFAQFDRPTALAFGPGGAFGESMYVLDHDGLTSTVYTVDPAGNAALFATGFRSAATSTPDLAFSVDGSTLYVAIEDQVTAITVDAPFERAECNGDGGIDIADPVFLLEHLFLGAPVPPCRDACDANDDGLLDLADAIFILNYTFGGGSAPSAPGATCGGDPTPDPLDCVTSDCAD